MYVFTLDADAVWLRSAANAQDAKIQDRTGRGGEGEEVRRRKKIKPLVDFQNKDSVWRLIIFHCHSDNNSGTRHFDPKEFATYKNTLNYLTI